MTVCVCGTWRGVQGNAVDLHILGFLHIAMVVLYCTWVLVNLVGVAQRISMTVKVDTMSDCHQLGNTNSFMISLISERSNEG
ncbi:hypothetical protein BP00DRAFT_184726 [Aspergillus indologenus CBS 114.80]|uniref:Uncharacterized protein n=1 Tax=Aspergillus indologenus CBS 114.80 TaxID=1450541 RepID=A0A2V5J1V6_9EURO|nr:hypothetical protein BP00DRAFT_184726 [Aspergillus indologenus CBS 114.80]